jgi:hypothetical protein
VPTHEKILREEERCQDLKLIRDKFALRGSKKLSLLGEVQAGHPPHLRVTSPGPQYLYFLEKGILLVGVGEFATARSYSELTMVVVGGMCYFFDLYDKYSLYWYRPFGHFIERFNTVHPEVKGGELVPPESSDQRFPREVVWFYGVERLLNNVGLSEDDWKSLPMLLWD